jgi:TRAP-type uncharacterized transport system substrate-binding protein
MRTDITLKDLFSNTLKTRRIVILITLFFSIATYYYLVDFYATDFSIVSYLPGRKLPQYEIYSGNERLTYYLVGSYLEEELKTVKNEITKGGIENAQRVLTSQSPSFGLVQEDVLKADDFMKTHLNFAAPIYLERMHIIYDKKVFESYQKRSQEDNIPQISSYTRPELLDFFAHAKINIGPVGSGTRIIASYIMEAINEQIRAQQAERINTKMAASVEQFRGELARGNNPTHSSTNSMPEQRPRQDEINVPEPRILLTDTWDALHRLNAKYTSDKPSSASDSSKDGIPDIVFVVTGSPCESVAKLIMGRSGQFGLISIDSTFINNLNLKHGTNFRATDFSGKYDKYKGAATLGTYAYLVTDQRTPTIDILTILDRLNALKPKKQEEEKAPQEESAEEKLARISNALKKKSEGKKTPEKISEEIRLALILENDFDFLAYYEKQSKSRRMLPLRNLLVFLVTLGTAFTPSFIFLSWFVSGIQQMKYMAKLSKVIEENIPINEEHEQAGESEAGDAAGAVESGVGDRKKPPPNLKAKQKSTAANAVISLIDKVWLTFRGWIDSIIQLVRKFIRSGKVTGEGAISDDENKKDHDVGSKRADGSAGLGDAHDREYIRPKINPDQRKVVNKIIVGLISLNKLRKDISKDTGVNDTHTTFLIGRIDQIVDKLRKSLAIRLNGVIENYDQEVNEKLLLEYLTADWLTKDDYEWLITKLREGK